MTPYSKDESMIHFEVPCPACGGKAYVVADNGAQKARWCCTDCQTLGAAPFWMSPDFAPSARPFAQA